jgi:hypothetical protein
MTTTFGLMIDRESWEVYIVDPFSPMVSISRGERTSLNRESSPTERGLVIRDKSINQSIFLPAVGALEIIKDMLDVDIWKNNGIMVGIPVLTSDPCEKKESDEEILRTPFIRRNPEYAFSEHLMLTPEQSKDLIGFLIENEKLLNDLAEKDATVARRQMKDLFGKIAEYGRRKRLNKS